MGGQQSASSRIAAPSHLRVTDVFSLVLAYISRSSGSRRTIENASSSHSEKSAFAFRLVGVFCSVESLSFSISRKAGLCPSCLTEAIPVRLLVLQVRFWNATAGRPSKSTAATPAAITILERDGWLPSKQFFIPSDTPFLNYGVFYGEL